MRQIPSSSISLLNLPDEILQHVCDNTVKLSLKHGDSCPFEYVKRLRLTCKRLAQLCSPILFHTARLYPYTDACCNCKHLKKSSYIKDSLKLVTALQESSLSNLVREVALITPTHSKDHHHVATTSSDSQESDGLEESDDDVDCCRETIRWRKTIKTITSFPKLISVCLVFNPEVEDEENEWSDVEQTLAFRGQCLKAVFSALTLNDLPTANLRSLTIKSLQDDNRTQIMKSSKFGEVLSKINELHLHIATFDDEAAPETNIGYRSLHTFFRELPSIWLAPPSLHLTHLTLYCDTYWGWAPVFDPSSLHLPRLKYLSLGNYTFANDFQLAWLLSLGSTLETLILDDCPIAFYFYPSDSCQQNTTTLRHDDHSVFIRRPPLKGTNPSHRDNNHYVYSARWHQYFSKLEAGLPNLTNFVLGSGEWPRKCFDERNVLLPCLRRNRYIAFNGGIGPSQWCEVELYCGETESFGEIGYDPEVMVYSPTVREPPYYIMEEETEENFQSDAERGERNEGAWEAAVPKNPEVFGEGCQKQDQEAFASLLLTVAKRARDSGI